MRRAFTLIELMISISILSMIMLFLYKSYSELNSANSFYQEEAKGLERKVKIKETLFLDISLALSKSVKILNHTKQKDTLLMHSTHSLHRRINPYIAYVINNKRLYRVESFRELHSYPFESDSGFDVDYLGEVELFRVYKSKSQEAYLLEFALKAEPNIVLKVKVLNED